MDRIKDMAILVIVMIVLGTIVGCTATETESVRCCVTDCTKENADIYEITVESSKDHELYAYYDDVPRDEGTVIICEFTTENEIINAR